ncbi:anthranilate phosphoribosyltransferase [Streptomyces sp. HB372]|nr:anthranilate phosphoribosyltransferase [Streptomyces sp. HB372]
MDIPVPHLIHQINDPADIPPDDIRDGLLRLLALPASHTRDVMLGSLLTGLLLRGPRIDEVEAAVRTATLLDRDTWEFHRPPEGLRFVGYTGSGKKTFKTINLSSAAALVAATAGAHIAKLGSRSASSRTGSRDFTDLVGATCGEVPTDEMVGIAAECGFGFFSIEDRVPEFDRRYGGRFQSVHALSLAFPALLSPVTCSSYVYGLAHPATGVSARLLDRFELPDVTVVNSRSLTGLRVDELLPGTKVQVSRMRTGREDRQLAGDVRDAAAALPHGLSAVAQHTTPAANVAAVVHLLAGRGTRAARAAVALNAALLLRSADVAPSFHSCLATALEVLDTDGALDTLRRFVRLTGGTSRALDSLLADHPLPHPASLRKEKTAC